MVKYISLNECVDNGESFDEVRRLLGILFESDGVLAMRSIDNCSLCREEHNFGAVFSFVDLNGEPGSVTRGHLGLRSETGDIYVVPTLLPHYMDKHRRDPGQDLRNVVLRGEILSSEELRSVMK